MEEDTNRSSWGISFRWTVLYVCDLYSKVLYHRIILSMEIPNAYSLAFLSVLASLVCLHTMSSIWSKFHRSLYGILLRHIVYPRIFPGMHLINPTRSGVFLYVIHWATTLFCNIYRVQSIAQAGLRAGRISIVHLVPLIASPQLSFNSDLMGLSLSTFKHLHYACGVMATAQGLFHSLASIRSLKLATSWGSNSLAVGNSAKTAEDDGS